MTQFTEKQKREAKQVYIAAVDALGGESVNRSIVDLFLDNLAWLKSIEEARELITVLNLDRVRCFYIVETSRDENGYIPVLVERGVSGYRPMTGNGEGASPWYWGKTLEEAEKACARQNLKMFGIDADIMFDIVASSMRASNRR